MIFWYIWSVFRGSSMVERLPVKELVASSNLARGAMKKTSVRSYIYFGTAIRYLQDVREGYSLYGNGRIIENIEEAIKSLEDA